MWSEARRQEKRLRELMVDHKKRAERRKEFYEKMKQDPAQFLQLHGRPLKIHLDPAIAAAADAPVTMMPWRGNKDVMIDRFDGRAHLDFIPEYKSQDDQEKEKNTREARDLNYERYRILVQNDFLKITEERFLRTIEMEEKFGGQTYSTTAKKAKEDKKKAKEGKAAIGFVYEDSTADDGRPVPPNLKNPPTGFGPSSVLEQQDEDGDDSDSDLDLDLSVDLMSLGAEAQKDINKVGRGYELGREDFIRYLAKDIEEQEHIKAEKEKEGTRARRSGKKSRRARRAAQARKVLSRKISPPSFATRSSPSYDDYYTPNRRRSCSNSSVDSLDQDKPVRETGKVEFITSFGGESDEEPVPELRLGKAIAADAKSRLKRLKMNAEETLPFQTASLPRKSDDKADFKARSSKRGARRRSKSRSQSRSRSYARRRDSSSDSDSSSSTSENEGKNSNRYRSKYRNRRRRSSSISSIDSDAAENGKRMRRKRSSSSSDDNRRRSKKSPSPPTKAPEPVKKNYYARIRANVKNDSDLSGSDRDSEEQDTSRPNKSAPSLAKCLDSNNADRGSPHGTRSIDAGSSRTSSGTSSFKDKIKKRMQAQIKRQFKIDKLAEEERKRKQEEDRYIREEELRELSFKMRKRDRERRQGEVIRSSDSDNDRHELSSDEERSRRRKRRSGSREARRDSYSGSKRKYRRSRSRSPARYRSYRRSRSRSRGYSRRGRSRSRSYERQPAPRLVDY